MIRLWVLLVAAVVAASSLAGASAVRAGCCVISVDDYSPTWSPDGERIAYTHIAGGVFATQIVPSEGGPPRGVAAGYNPAWAPDGLRVAVAAREGIQVVTPADSRVRPLTRAAGDSAPAWSPDGRTVAFRRPPGDVWAVSAEGGSPRLVARAFGSNSLTSTAQRVAWSPDGGSLAFVGRRTPQLRSDDEIRIVRADGSDERVLASSPRNDQDPAWSPDGRSLAFSSERDGNHEIYTVAADGSQLRNLTRYRGHDGEPAWSPDGRTIAFASARANRYEAQIYAIDAEGGQARPLGATRPANHPTWSPDGTRIAFIGRSECPGLGIYVMSRTGEGTARLSNDCTIRGTAGADRIVGKMGRDIVFALAGDDSVASKEGADIVFGEAGDDVLRGGTEPDRLDGGPGADVLHGEGSRDTLMGGPGEDRLLGGIGRDTLLARDGTRDAIDCGPQPDVVVADRSDRVAKNCERVSRR